MLRRPFVLIPILLLLLCMRRRTGFRYGLGKAGEVARDSGLKIAMGAWLGRDLAANEQEIENLIKAARKSLKKRVTT